MDFEAIQARLAEQRAELERLGAQLEAGTPDWDEQLRRARAMGDGVDGVMMELLVRNSRELATLHKLVNIMGKRAVELESAVFGLVERVERLEGG